MIFIARWWQWWWCYFFSFFQTWVTKHFNNFIEYSFLKALREWRFISVLFCFVSILTETVAQRCSVKQVFLEISQNSQKIICARPATLVNFGCFWINQETWCKLQSHWFPNFSCVLKSEWTKTLWMYWGGKPIKSQEVILSPHQDLFLVDQKMFRKYS